MAKPNKSQTLKSKPNTSGKISRITKTKQLVSKNVKVVASRRSARLNRLKSFRSFGVLHHSDLESKIVWHVLSNFTLTQQLKMRTISPVWDYNVQLACKQIRSLELHFTNETIIKDDIAKLVTWENFIKYYVTNLKRFPVTNIGKIFIKPGEWKHSTNATLGKLFCNVEQLTITFTVNSDNNELLFNLLRYFPKVTEFSLIILTKIKKSDIRFACQLFSAIADHLAPLTSLYIYFESIYSKKVDVLSLRKILPFLQNLSLCCPVENYRQIIGMMGKKLPPHFPIQSLSFRASSLKVSQIKQMFKHNRQLAKMKRLQLLDVDSREVVDCLLDRFTELECLDICAGSKLNTENDYSVEWMKTFSKLSHLKELALVGMHPKNFGIEVPVALPTVRRLTFICPDFISSICVEWLNMNINVEAIETSFTRELFTQILKEFAVSFVKQYPNLERLHLGWDFDFRSEFVEILSAKYDNLQTYYYPSQKPHVSGLLSN